MYSEFLQKKEDMSLTEEEISCSLAEQALAIAFQRSLELRQHLLAVEGNNIVEVTLNGETRIIRALKGARRQVVPGTIVKLELKS